MTDTHRTVKRIPALLINPDSIAAHLESLDSAPLCDSCRNAIIPVAADAVASLTEAIRLWDALCKARMESANRLAAMRAALHAAAESEPDPLAYLRDQLAEETSTADPASGR